MLSTSSPSTFTRAGKVRYGVAAWLLGAPTIVIIIALLFGGLFKW